MPVATAQKIDDFNWKIIPRQRCLQTPEVIYIFLLLIEVEPKEKEVSICKKKVSTT